MFKVYIYEIHNFFVICQPEMLKSCQRVFKTNLMLLFLFSNVKYSVHGVPLLLTSCSAMKSEANSVFLSIEEEKNRYSQTILSNVDVQMATFYIREGVQKKLLF